MRDALTPMMQQYRRVRGSIPADTLLLFRLGDFYELFFEDAKEAAVLLNVALTKRNGVPMCGMPYHAAQTYIAKLIKAGRRVAICDQTSEPQPGKIVSRDITQIVSAGTVSDLDLLESKRANYLGAVHADSGVFGFAYADLSTGEFRITQLQDRQSLLDEIARVSPSELLVSDEQQQQFKEIENALGYDSYAFLPEQAVFTLCEHFKVKSLDGFGCAQMLQAVAAAGAIVHYLKHQLRRKIDHLASLRSDAPADYVLLDAATQSNLELVEPRTARDTTLLAVLDRTGTPMGGRKLRAWILQPLRNLPELQRRHQMIADLLQEPDLLAAIRGELKSIRDIERATGRLSQASGNARDLLGLKTSLQEIPKLKGELQKLIERISFGKTPIIAEEDGGPNASPARTGRALPVELHDNIHEMPELAEKLEKALVDDPPLALKEGGIFGDGYNCDLDELRRASRDGKNWISQLQEREIAATGIKSLKVRYNSVFGYFIEITKSNLANAPAHYERKQTTVGGERFVTPELKKMEATILGADERARQLEYQLFQKLREETLRELGPIQQTAEAIAVLDAICALTETARLFRYCRPALNETLRLVIKDGRHPVLDQTLVEEKFVPNDTSLDGENLRLAIITGPNMAGKSTYIRQVALIVLMAQIGSFVPAESAEIGLVDRIFTRVGANDDLARGQSTFMVEMNETSNIVNNATERSLVILDEIGRGTSTFDGLSIAWSVAEFLHDKIKARTLFATHYHELTKLSEDRPGVCNFNVAVREWNEQIIFLRKILPGGADKSYGIQVARLAGLPKEILDRAKEILAKLEKPDGVIESPLPGKSRRKGKPAASADKPQMDLL
ncbi:MAG: DNA mismatch repair protein MutS [Verrucomicrobia bacterium]|nr:MAG: DNA mismatch repair protein MutS [Verrucomicrobia bacterium 13_2_20CM_55_10]OLB18718.1 MAG: DNA mismatch repair protein MutS [Verrucomicrobia bacterium 13_2_20CM_2_54_15_9cls]PYI44006.1 MAG: DNA mismatch repair protein MutS [Verrucomicrobiota bacterium]